MIEIGFTDELTNTQYAPLAILSEYYQQNQTLENLQEVQIPMIIRDFSPGDKLIQTLLSILAGCKPLYEINTRLKQGSESSQGHKLLRAVLRMK